MEPEMHKKPLLCRLHMHQVSIDAAYFTRAQICNRCNEYLNPVQAEKLILERALWGEAADLGLFHEKGLAYVRAHLNGTNLDLVPPRPVV